MATGRLTSPSALSTFNHHSNEFLTIRGRCHNATLTTPKYVQVMKIKVVLRGGQEDMLPLLSAISYAADERATVCVVPGPRCEDQELAKQIRFACWNASEKGLIPPRVLIEHGSDREEFVCDADGGPRPLTAEQEAEVKYMEEILALPYVTDDIVFTSLIGMRHVLNIRKECIQFGPVEDRPRTDVRHAIASGLRQLAGHFHPAN